MSMKFALRDDDLNYFYKPEVIENNYKDIWDICPVSMSTVPYMKGNWPKNVMEAEARGPGVEDESLLNHLKTDNQVFPIGDNVELVKYVKEKIEQNKIYLTIHGIYHRNEDIETPKLKGNFGFGAEFYTTRDLTKELKKAVKYLEDTFMQKINVFIPPQNIYTMKGLMAIKSNNLALCTGFPDVKSKNCLKLFGLSNYLNFFVFKLLNRKKSLKFPEFIEHNQFKMVDNYSINTDIKKLCKAIDYAHKSNGVFVLTTHSYGFDFKMKNSDLTIKEGVKKVIQYAKAKGNVQFVNLDQIFEK